MILVSDYDKIGFTASPFVSTEASVERTSIIYV